MRPTSDAAERFCCDPALHTSGCPCERTRPRERLHRRSPHRRTPVPPGASPSRTAPESKEGSLVSETHDVESGAATLTADRHLDSLRPEAASERHPPTHRRTVGEAAARAAAAGRRPRHRRHREAAQGPADRGDSGGTVRRGARAGQRHRQHRWLAARAVVARAAARATLPHFRAAAPPAASRTAATSHDGTSSEVTRVSERRLGETIESRPAAGDAPAPTRAACRRGAAGQQRRDGSAA